jgi:hypothetical protein
LQLEEFLFQLAPTGRDELERLLSSAGKPDLIIKLQSIGARKVDARVEPGGVDAADLDKPVMVWKQDVPTPAERISWRVFNVIRSFVNDDEDEVSSPDTESEIMVEADPWQHSSLDGFILSLVQDANIAELTKSIRDKATKARPLEIISAGSTASCHDQRWVAVCSYDFSFRFSRLPGSRSSLRCAIR